MLDPVTTTQATTDRSARTRTTLLDAAEALILEQGISGFTVEGLFQRTGIAKTTIYRHWPSRSDLLAAAIDSMSAHASTPDTGSLRRDLLTYFVTGARSLEGSPLGKMASLAGIVEAGQRDPEVVAAVKRTSTLMLGTMRELLERGRARGEVRDDRDLGAAANTLVGAIFIRTVFLDARLSDEYLADVVDTVIEGLSPR
jgi:AcrR family transcriptional regulator